jgi:hypothetical protein
MNLLCIADDRFVKQAHRQVLANRRRKPGDSTATEASTQAMICYKGFLVLAVLD